MSNDSTDFNIAIAIYPHMDLMDVAAPYEIFNWMAGNWSGRNVHVYLAAESLAPVKTRDGLEMTPQILFDDLKQVDLLWIPGGDPDAGLAVQMANPAYVNFIKRASEKATYVTSVCEGALIAANSGLLDGFEATTHWAFIECLRSYPKIKVHPGYPRYVHDGNRVTGGGISSGLDEALYLVKLIAGEEVAKDVQVTLQYFPCPPVSGELPSSSPCPMAGKIPVPVPPPNA